MDLSAILPIALPMFNCHHLSKGCLQQCSKYPPVFGLSSSFQTILNKSSIQFSRSVLSDSLRPHGLQHPRPPCPSPAPGVYPNPCPLSWWCHLTISSSVVPFSSCPQSFPSIRVFSNESALCIRWPKYWSFNKGNRLIFLKFNPEHITPLLRCLFCAFSKFHASADATGVFLEFCLECFLLPSWPPV